MLTSPTCAAPAAIRLTALEELTSAWLDCLCEGSAPKPPVRCCLQAQEVKQHSMLSMAPRLVVLVEAQGTTS